MQLGLLDWFVEHGRHSIPWKLKSDGSHPKNNEALNPYGIWIAEVMLQQTQLHVVLPYWERWMQTLPTLLDLVQASEQEILLLWQGLGYYSRARRIHKSAHKLLEVLGGADSLDPSSWPSDLKTWMSLPGIGRSTAGSIISSAFNLPKSLLDGNVQRVLSRLIANPRPAKDCLPVLWDLSDQLMDKQNPRHFNQALMDLGAMVCTPSSPNCIKCPWNAYCIAYSSRQTQKFPVKAASRPLPFQVIGIGVVFNDFGEVLIDQRLDGVSMGGMWEFPGGKKELDEEIEETIKRELREELGIQVEVGDLLISIEHSYSHKKLLFIVHICHCIAGKPQPLASQQCRWVQPNELDQYPFPVANSKMISALKTYLQKDN
nr:8-oxo-dGTP diphosphatase MutT [Prochlorococcus sp. MIT 1307]